MTSARPAPPEVGRPAPFPGWAALVTAARQLTVLGRGRPHDTVDRAAVYYPLIGLGLGAAWVAVDRLAGAFGNTVLASVAVVAAASALTGGRGARAIGRTLAPATIGRRQPLAALDGAAGVVPWLGCVLVLAAEVALLTALTRFRLIGLAFAPVLGCCSMVVLAVGSRAARADGRQVKFAPDVTFREFGIATTATFALLFLTSEFLGLLLVLATAMSSVAMRVGWHRWLGGVNASALWASAEATQIVALGVLAALS